MEDLSITQATAPSGGDKLPSMPAELNLTMETVNTDPVTNGSSTKDTPADEPPSPNNQQSVPDDLSVDNSKPASSQPSPASSLNSSLVIDEQQAAVPSVESAGEAQPADVPPETKGEPGDGDFDMESAMQWDNGIGTLPGSDMKFRMNEFGIMELVTDGLDNILDCPPENMDVDTPEMMSPSVTPDLNASGNSEEFCRCENCGTYGLKSEFVKSGRFCTHSCVGAFASRKNYQVKNETSLKEEPVSLKRKKKFSSSMMDMPSNQDTTGLKMRIKVNKSESEAEEIPQAPPAKKYQRLFHWDRYLDQEQAVTAPEKLFKSPLMKGKNSFRVSYKLEGIDPKHPSLYCVLSVAECRGYRVRMHFDGYSECYDFWVNADSDQIFPVGWCEKNNKLLQPPKGFTQETFNWTDYLKLSRSQPAPKQLFSVLQNTSVTPHGFRTGMKLEAVDKKNSSLICVATVNDVINDNILIHFDGWEDAYDYWCEPSSPYIHPVGWCQEHSRALSPPNDWKEVETFTWEDYMAQTNSLPVPSRSFKTRPPNSFEVGMKFEAVDKRNPILVRVATVAEKEDYRIMLHFDGWSESYDYWVDDNNTDIHPAGWCMKTGHSLQAPLGPRDLANSPSQSGCPTPGCSGIGHIKGAKYTGHHSAFGCPYSQINMNKETALADRTFVGRGESTSGDFKRNMFEYSPSASEPKGKCPTIGCDGSGHVTGKFTAHHKVSGCPLAVPDDPKKLDMSPRIMNGIPSPEPIKIPRPKGRPPGSGNKIKYGTGPTAAKHRGLPGRKRLHQKLQLKAQEKDNKMKEVVHESVFMPGAVPAPKSDLPVHWEHHSKLLPGVTEIQGHHVSRWSIDEVTNFVRSLPGCEEQANIFKEEQIDGEAFLLLNQTDIVKIMNIKLGPALKIYNSILIFKNSTEI